MYAIGEALDKVSAADDKKGLDELKYFIAAKYKNIGTRAVVYSTALNKLRIRFAPADMKLARRTLRLTKIDNKIKKNTERKRLWDKNMKPLRVSAMNVDLLLRQAEGAWEGEFVRLLLATGLRPNEIIGAANVKAAGVELEVAGLTKKRDKEFVHQRPCLGFSSEEVVIRLKQLRKTMKKVFPDLFERSGEFKENVSSSAGNHAVMRQVRRWLSHMGVGVVPRDLRMLYARLSHDLHVKDSVDNGKVPIPIQCWIPNVLGHETNSFQSMLHYLPVIIE